MTVRFNTSDKICALQQIRKTNIEIIPYFIIVYYVLECNQFFLTFRSSFSISSANCVLNFEPTDMKFNFPLEDALLFLPENRILINGFADSCTNASNDACNASLFLSIN